MNMDRTKFPPMIDTRTANPAKDDTPKYCHNITMATDMKMEHFNTSLMTEHERHGVSDNDNSTVFSTACCD